MGAQSGSRRAYRSLWMGGPPRSPYVSVDRRRGKSNTEQRQKGPFDD